MSPTLNLRAPARLTGVSALGILAFIASKEAIELLIGSQDLWINWLAPVCIGVGIASLSCLALDHLNNPWGDKKSTKGPDYRHKLSEFTRTLELIAGSEQLESALVGQLSEILDAPKVALFLREPDGDQFLLRGQIGYERSELDGLAFEEKGQLASWLRTNEIPLRVWEDREVMAYLPEHEREPLQSYNVDLCLPLSAMNRLVGIALVERRERTPLKDPRSLRDLCSQGRNCAYAGFIGRSAWPQQGSWPQALPTRSAIL